MPNGGPTPACVLCSLFTKQDARCNRHQFKVGNTAARLVCKDFEIKPVSQTDDHIMKTNDESDTRLESNWRKMVDITKKLQPKFLYFWSEIAYYDFDLKYQHTFDLFPFAFIHDYAAWTEDEVRLVSREVYRLNRQLHAKVGYSVRPAD